MKSSDIHINGIYERTTGVMVHGEEYSYLRIDKRKVLDISIDGKYTLYKGQHNCHTVQYKNLRTGEINNCTMIAFSKWAEREAISENNNRV